MLLHSTTLPHLQNFPHGSQSSVVNFIFSTQKHPISLAISEFQGCGSTLNQEPRIPSKPKFRRHNLSLQVTTHMCGCINAFSLAYLWFCAFGFLPRFFLGIEILFSFYIIRVYHLIHLWFVLVISFVCGILFVEILCLINYLVRETCKGVGFFGRSWLLHWKEDNEKYIVSQGFLWMC